SARDLGDDHGILYYETPAESTYRGYADLDRRARAIAQALVARGYGPGQLATIGLTSGLDWADGAFGALYAGLAFVPAPVAGYGTGAQVGERVAGIARSAEASVFITDRSVLEKTGGELPGLDLPIVLLEDLLAEGD